MKLLIWEIKWGTQDILVTLRLNRLLMPIPDPAHLPTAYIKVLLSGMSFWCIGLFKQMLPPVFGAALV